MKYLLQLPVLLLHYDLLPVQICQSGSGIGTILQQDDVLILKKGQLKMKYKGRSMK